MAKENMRDVIASNVARILREEREKHHLSMTELAQKSGLSQAMISFVEREIRNPSLDTLLRIAEALELNLGEIIIEAINAAAKPTDRHSAAKASLDSK